MFADSKDVVKSAFNNLEKIEVANGKDFYMFERANMIEAISSIAGRKNATKMWILSTLRDYIDWCVMQGVVDYNILNDIGAKEIKISSDIKQETLANVEHLRSALEVGFPELNDQDLSMNTLHKLYAFLLYFGFSSEEILGMKKYDAKINREGYINYSQKSVYVQPFLKDMLDKAVNQDAVIRSRGFNKSDSYTKLIKTDLLISAIRSIDYREQSFRCALTRMNKLYLQETGKYIKLTIVRIYESGMFYRLLQKEMMGNDIANDVIIQDFNVSDELGYYSKHSKIYNIRTDYENWKKVWNYNL